MGKRSWTWKLSANIFQKFLVYFPVWNFIFRKFNVGMIMEIHSNRILYKLYPSEDLKLACELQFPLFSKYFLSCNTLKCIILWGRHLQSHATDSRSPKEFLKRLAAVMWHKLLETKEDWSEISKVFEGFHCSRVIPGEKEKKRAQKTAQLKKKNRPW